MCLGIPGQIVEVIPNEKHPNFCEGRVSFGGVMKTISLAYAPEATTGDYLIVHAGFAISVIDKTQAQRVWQYLDEMEEVAELKVSNSGTD